VYKLYGWKLTGSLATEAALNEIGAEYEIVPINIREGEQHTQEYRLVNPTGQVPIGSVSAFAMLRIFWLSEG